MRICVFISFDGNRFQGYQEQNLHTNTVSNKIQFAFSSLNINSKPIGSSRTDKGVHALNQSFHIDLPEFWNDFSKLKFSLNKILHPHIHVKQIYRVNDEFHARFNAKARLYKYILNHNEFNPFFSPYCLFYPKLNLEKLNQALSMFNGTHNFIYFKKQGSFTKNDTRVVFKSFAYKYKNYTIICIKANGFLRSQVRMMISASLKVQKGELSIKCLKEQIEAKKQYSTSLIAANGLYLARIFY